MDREYHDREMKRLFKRIEDIEKAPLSERREGREDYLRGLRDNPDIIAERVTWILNGAYGYAEQFRAKYILENCKRKSAVVQLAYLVAAFDDSCPQVFAAQAFKKLMPEQQEKINNLIAQEVEDWEKEQKEEKERQTERKEEQERIEKFLNE